MNLMTKKLLFPLLMASYFLIGCASEPATDPLDDNPLAAEAGLQGDLTARLNELGYVGKTSIKRIGYTRFSGWAYVDDTHITVTFGASRNYLIEFRSPCRDAQFAQSLRFDTHMSSITPGDRAFMGRDPRTMIPCWIDSLYELEKKPKEETEAAD
jgi:hypothetical protein